MAEQIFFSPNFFLNFKTKNSICLEDNHVEETTANDDTAKNLPAAKGKGRKRKVEVAQKVESPKKADPEIEEENDAIEKTEVPEAKKKGRGKKNAENNVKPDPPSPKKSARGKKVADYVESPEEEEPVTEKGKMKKNFAFFQS